MIEYLEKQGLTKYESRVYISLVKEGLSTAHQISQKSKVPYGKIYTVLASLVEKGFLKNFEGVPQRFQALDPTIVINHNIRKKEEELNTFKEQSKKLIRGMGELSNKKKEPMDKVKTIEGYKNYLNLSIELHNKTKKRWYTISELSTYKPHIDVYKECIKRGVKVKILVSLPEANEEKIKIWKETGAELRGVDIYPTKFSVIDDTDVTLRLAKDKKYISLWLKNNALAQIMADYFDNMWKTAKKL